MVDATFVVLGGDCAGSVVVDGAVVADAAWYKQLVCAGFYLLI